MFGSRSGRGFAGTIDYDRDLDGRHKKDARILYARGVDVFYNPDGVLDADSRQLARSFRAQAMMNPDVKKCVNHLWISYKPGDLLAMVNNCYTGKRHFISLDDSIVALGEKRINAITNKTMVEDTMRLLKEMKYDNTQFIIVRHSEKDNPHVHVILNMVDNEGARLNDFQEKKRGIEICKQITLDRHYTWGDHKSVSKTVSHNPKENARAEICKEVFDITHADTLENPVTAKEFEVEVKRRDIGIKFLTDFNTGEITGISFAKDGFLFPASRVDASLSTNKLFPSQVKSQVPLCELPIESQNIVKAGGIVKGFNDQILHEAVAPSLPRSVQESMARDKYHLAIEQARKAGSRTAYMQNIAGLALDPNCGPSEDRAEAVSPYITYVTDEVTNQAADLQRIKEIIRIADEQARQKKRLFKRFFEFLRNLMKESLNLKEYSIVTDKGRKEIQWHDLLDGAYGKVVGMAQRIKDDIEKAYNENGERVRKQKETPTPAPRPTPTQSSGQTPVPPVKPSRQEEPKVESESKSTSTKITFKR